MPHALCQAQGKPPPAPSKRSLRSRGDAQQPPWSRPTRPKQILDRARLAAASRRAPGHRRPPPPRPPSLPPPVPPSATSIAATTFFLEQELEVHPDVVGSPSREHASAGRRESRACRHRLRAGFARWRPPTTAKEAVVKRWWWPARFSTARVAQERERCGGPKYDDTLIILHIFSIVGDSFEI
jgi:hypothetical protein